MAVVTFALDAQSAMTGVLLGFKVRPPGTGQHAVGRPMDRRQTFECHYLVQGVTRTKALDHRCPHTLDFRSR